MKYNLVLLFCLLYTLCGAKELKYLVSDIPDSLKTNAFAVVRDDSYLFEIKSLTQTTTRYIKAITVLNENGKSMGYMSFSYDNNLKIVSIEANCYNTLGIKEETKSRKDFEDNSYDPFGTTYTDKRILSGKFSKNSYPYTIEYIVTYEEDNTYSFPVWLPVDEFNMAVQKSSLTVRYPQDYKFRYLEKNLDNKITVSQLHNERSWVLTNCKPVIDEPYSPDLIEYVPCVITAPSEFVYDNYKGNLNDWKNFGDFGYQLTIGRDQLPPEQIKIIKELTDTCKNDLSKVKVLYKYMQSNTRFVSVQVGIGGIQPISAELVAKTGYGDCKALTNYMKSLLKYVGITSYDAWIRAGSFRYSFDRDFVSDRFNHAILCVPMKNDTIWLECTNQSIPFGFLGDFTENRPTMLLTEKGGVISKTPGFPMERNQINLKATVKILENNTCKASVKAYYSGLEYDNMHELAIEDIESQKKLIYEHVEIPSFTIDKFSFSATDGPDPVLTENLNLTLNNYCSTTGSRMFIPMNLMSKWTSVPKRMEERKRDVVKRYACIYTDTIQYIIPDGYKIEALPEKISIDGHFGKYNSETILENNTVTYLRKLEIKSGRYPANDYDNFIAFFSDIRNKDKATLVLKKSAQ